MRCESRALLQCSFEAVCQNVIQCNGLKTNESVRILDAMRNMFLSLLCPVRAARHGLRCRTACRALHMCSRQRDVVRLHGPDICAILWLLRMRGPNIALSSVGTLRERRSC